MNEYGRMIYDFRKTNGLTQIQLAEMIGCDRSYLVQIENGKRLPGRNFRAKFQQICETLK